MAAYLCGQNIFICFPLDRRVVKRRLHLWYTTRKRAQGVRDKKAIFYELGTVPAGEEMRRPGVVQALVQGLCCGLFVHGRLPRYCWNAIVVGMGTTVSVSLRLPYILLCRRPSFPFPPHRL